MSTIGPFDDTKTDVTALAPSLDKDQPATLHHLHMCLRPWCSLSIIMGLVILGEQLLHARIAMATDAGARIVALTRCQVEDEL